MSVLDWILTVLILLALWVEPDHDSFGGPGNAQD